MLLLRLLINNLLMGSILIIMIMTHNVNGKPQGPNIFEDVATKGLAMVGNLAEMVGNADKITQNHGFDIPFFKANSSTDIGTGAAFRNDEDSSEEDRRKKRSINALQGRPHKHRNKRSPCHSGTGGGGTTGGGDVPTDGDDVDVAERRRRAYARKMAARKKAANAKKATRKSTTGRRKTKLVDDDVEQTLTRRKRQTELDDLNDIMNDNSSKDLQQHAQQVVEKLRSYLESFMNSLNQVAQNVKQQFGFKNSTNSQAI